MTTTTDRIGTLDFTRGVAVLGILLLNIVNFGMPQGAYINPAAYGGATGLDLVTYCINFVLFDGKMRGLFSLLFGASLLLVAQRAEAKHEDPAQVHFRRMAALLVFGLVHLWLIWDGDILGHYALIGMVAFAFRGRSSRSLVQWAIGLIVLQTLLSASVMPAISTWTRDAATDPEAAQRLAGIVDSFGIPDRAVLARELVLMRSDYSTIVAARFAENRFTVLTSLIAYGFETLGYMLLGMAALRSGMLRGAWSRTRYARWAAIGLATGIVGYGLLLFDMTDSGFAVTTMVRDWYVLTGLLRPAMIIGWAALLVLLMRPGGALTSRLAAAGRMAFTNYIATSVICTTLFYGYGFGLFGHLTRAQLYPVVAGIWILILLWSKPWLARFHFGPLEWVWRSLARGSPQPLRR